jgi:prepilin-type N-terminal cleavage/methylation domain-containing protein
VIRRYRNSKERLDQTRPDAPSVIRGSAGFTLIEVVVAFTIMALLTAALFVSFRLAVNSYRTGQERMESEAYKRALEDQIKRQIGSLFPLRPALSFASLQRQGGDTAEALALSQIPLFHGDPMSMTFITVAPLLLHENPGLTVVRYGLAEDEYGTSYLGAMEARFLGFDSFARMIDIPRGKPLPLIHPVRQLRFEYYGYDLQMQDFAWFAGWNAEQRRATPTAVRIHADDRTITVRINASFNSMPFAGMAGGVE